MKLLFSFSFLPFFHFIYLHSSSREQTSKRLVYLSTQQYSRGMIRYQLAERTSGRSCTTQSRTRSATRVWHPLLDRSIGLPSLYPMFEVARNGMSCDFLGCGSRFIHADFGLLELQSRLARTSALRLDALGFGLNNMEQHFAGSPAASQYDPIIGTE